MKNLFVPYELALKLKEKGFNEKCFGWWFADGSLKMAWKDGALSPEAKEYWQQGVYTEEEVRILLNNYMSYFEDEVFSKSNTIGLNVNQWFEQNKKKP